MPQRSTDVFERGRHLIYTVIVGDYDRLKVPLWRPKNVDYIAFSSEFDLPHFRGWRVVHLEDGVSNPIGVSRRLKILGGEFGNRYESIVYVDGSIQIVGSLKKDISSFLSSRCALGVFRHRDRSNPWEELVACQQVGHFSRDQYLFEENRLQPYGKMGVNLKLYDAGILMKNPRHARLEVLVSRWFALFNENPIRDQLSLPIAVWESQLAVHEFCHWTHKISPTFLRHPHRGDGHVLKALFWLGALCPAAFQVLLKLKR